MVLRILGDDSHSLAPLGSKFGANVETEVPHVGFYTLEKFDEV